MSIYSKVISKLRKGLVLSVRSEWESKPVPHVPSLKNAAIMVLSQLLIYTLIAQIFSKKIIDIIKTNIQVSSWLSVYVGITSAVSWLGSAAIEACKGAFNLVTGRSNDRIFEFSTELGKLGGLLTGFSKLCSGRYFLSHYFGSKSYSYGNK